MAAVSKRIVEPKPIISETAIPKPLREALHFIFQNVTMGVWFVGGSALAGYYAEHRRSDDIDLFVANAQAHQETMRAVKALATRGAELSHESTSPIFYRTDVQWLDHHFTIAVVVDENLHHVGSALKTKDGVHVVDLETLLAMKIACLVSRCSEKDLFDLDWLFEHAGFPSMETLIAMGQKIDGGLHVETLLVSLKGTMLRKEACNFLLPSSRQTVDQAYRKVMVLQKKLIRALIAYERRSPLSHDAVVLSRAARRLK